MSDLGAEVRGFCAAIGRDPLLVQAAGGNVSWKDGKTLWIKASGAWLAESLDQDIFVPVDLPALEAAIAQGEFDARPQPKSAGPLRPSIETMLHAVMPHPVVVHLHPVEALAHLVRGNAESDIRERLAGQVDFAFVDYHMPGARLAAAVAAATSGRHVDLVFFRNHGAIIGAQDVTGARHRLELVTRLLQVPVEAESQATSLSGSERGGYRLPDDPRLHDLATSPRHLAHVRAHWALYPDHVVFLGAAPVVLREPAEPGEGRPPFLFVEGRGVLQSCDAHRGHAPQLRCYLDVLERQPADAPLVTLQPQDVAELMGWDAEKYRQSLAAGRAAT